ncbi:MAG: hypothetical protein P1V20_15715 [Verrucomicrobiales bacterium]|nr:hypothetical protein [Verrucomicrobiales bacterium]
MNRTSAMVLAFFALAVAKTEGGEKGKNAISEASPGQEVKTHKVPFENYWDSTSWEKESGENFWHTTDEKTKITDVEKTTTRLRILRKLSGNEGS